VISPELEMPGELSDFFRLARTDGQGGIGFDAVELGPSGVLDDGAGDSGLARPAVEVEKGVLAVDPDRYFREGAIEPHAHEGIASVLKDNLRACVCALCNFLAAPHLEVGPQDDDLLELAAVLSHRAAEEIHRQERSECFHGAALSARGPCGH